MKTPVRLLPTMMLFLGSLVSGAVSAAPYEHPCEIVYYELNKPENTSGYTLEDFLTCKKQFGDTKLIRKAEKYKEKIADRLETVEQKIQESIAVAKGERSGKIIQTFDFEQLKGHRKNVMKLPFASQIHLMDDDDKHETSADSVCKILGYESSIANTQSQKFSSGDREALQEVPDRIFEMRKGGLFSSDKNIVHTFNKKRPSHNTRMYFRYYTSLTCEREIKQGEPVQDYELDIEAIKKAVEREVDAPKLDEEVKHILSIGRSASEGRANSIGESDVDDYSNDDRNWEPEIERDDFFLVVPK